MTSPVSQNYLDQLVEIKEVVDDVEWCRCLSAQPVVNGIDLEEYPGRRYVGCVNGDIVSFSPSVLRIY